MKWFSLCLSWFMFCATAHAAPPGSIEARYQLSKNGMTGEVVETYSQNGNHYTLASTTTLLGGFVRISVTSRGLIDKQGLRPQHFEYQFRGRPDKDRTAVFDWDAQQLTLTHQTPPLAPGTQDRLSAMYQFMFINFEGRRELDFFMTDGNKLDNYHYAVSPGARLDTPAGKFDSLYLDNLGKPGESHTEIWLESKYQLPCKMIVTDANGDQLTQILSSLKILP